MAVALMCVLSLAVFVADAAVGGKGSEGQAAPGGNANLHLGKTVVSGSFNPSLDVSLAVDHSTAIPGDALSYQATLTNSGAKATLTGDLTAGNTNATTATVASYWDSVATSSNPGQGCPTNHGHDTAQWTPFVGAAASQSGYTPVVLPPIATGMTLSLTPVPASGVSYPSSGDRMLGARLAPGATATWHYVASIPLSVAQEDFLLDPKQVTKLRNTLHAEVSPRNANAAQPAFVDTCFKPSLFGNSPGTATGAKIVIAPPTGAPVTFSAPSTPALASLAPGASVKVSTPYRVPAVSAKGASESDGDYLARLQALDGSALTANASATAESSGGPLSAKAQPVSTTEQLPVLAITKTGPSSAEAGTTVDYELALKNSGGARASSLVATDKASDETAGTVSELPTSLAPAAIAAAKAALAVPSSEPSGELTDNASLSWQDANGNVYGPISSSATTTINSVAGISPIATTTVQGNFYAAESSAQTFTAKPGDAPAFGQNFPTIDFNPPAGTIAHMLAGLPTVDPTTRPFTDITTDQVGNGNGVILAQGSGQQAGVGPLNAFDAALTANFVVAKAGDVTFNIVHDDGFLLGIGGGATRISGAYENPPESNASSFHGYPLMGAFNEQSGLGPRTDSVTVHFPKAGSYPYELDYFESAGTELSLTMTVASFAQTTSPLNVYVGYADGLRPSGSIFPFPWAGSPGVTFVGGGTFDSGALRFRNDSNAPIPLESVTVDVGGAHFDLWPRNMIVPAGEDLILAQTASYNFDSSDFSGAGCGGNDGVIPKVNVTIGGQTEVFADSNQVLNTKGFDLACQGNESTSWQLVGGEGAVINTPLPPATSLTLSPAGHTTLNVGQEQVFTAAAIDSNGKPVAKLPVTLALFGPNAQHLTATTDGSGVAKFSAILGHNAGADSVQATAFVQGRLTVSDTSTLTWNIPVPGGPPSGGTPEQAPPSITEIGPPNGTEVTKPVPITATIKPPTGETITSWKVTAQALDPEPIIVLASGKGAPPSPLATFDPTRLPNGTYEITVSATASGGGAQAATSTVAVHGNLKLGRYTTTYQDLVVPVNGFQMAVRRVYDSIDKRVGDFGVGWHVEVANFRVSTNRELGAGGWSEYGTNCFGSLCLYAFKTSAPHYVTVTFPGGHQEVFDFTPEGGSTLFSAATPKFTARPNTGTTSTLTAAGSLGLTATGDLVDEGGNPYNPTRFTLETHDGRVLVLDTTSGLVSETDRTGNALTVDSTGVHSTLGPAPGTPGPSIAFTRDAAHGNRITDIAGPLAGQHWHYGYNGGGELESATDPNEHTDTYKYYPAGQLELASDPNHQPLQTLTYDPEGRLESIANGTQPPIKIATNVSGQTQTLLDPNGKLTTTLRFDELGDVLERDDTFNGKTLKSTFTYDSVGRLKTATDPLKHTISKQYDEASGNLLSTTDPMNRKWSIENYNPLGEPEIIRSPDTSVLLKLTYDPITGELLSTDQPGAEPSTFTYYPAGQLKSVTEPGGRTTTYGYDPTGHIETISDSQHHAVQVKVNAGGELESIKDQLGNTTELHYTPDGQVSQVTDPNENTTRYFYDALGRLEKAEDPLHKTTLYEYNTLGLLARRIDRTHGVTSYEYNVDGQVTSEERPGKEVLSFSYDPLGRLEESDNAAGHIDRTYNEAGLLETETTCANTGAHATHCGAVPSASAPIVSHKYGYWADNQLQSVESNDAGAVNYAYDGNGRLETVQDSGGSFHFAYDGLGQLASLTRPNHVNDTFTYTADGDLERRDAKLNGTIIAPFDYEIDPATGRREALTDSFGKHTFSYYDNGAVKSATHPAASGLANETYTYDKAGNRSSGSGIVGTAKYDAAGRLLTDGSFNYTYDEEGDLHTKTPVGGGLTTTYEWNADHQLLAVHYPDGSTSSYRYDPLGRRTAVLEDGKETRFAYGGSAIDRVYNSQNELQASYLDGLDSRTKSGQSSYLLQDGLGNLRGVTNEAGAVTGTYAYNTFGIPAGTNGPPMPGSFDGYQYDSASGLYHTAARYYDPAAGRFLSEDPMSSSNPYSYVANDPANASDPTGAELIEVAVQSEDEQPAETAAGKGLGECLVGALGGVVGALPGAIDAFSKGEGKVGAAGLGIGAGTGCAVGKLLPVKGWPSAVAGGTAGGATAGGATAAVQCRANPTAIAKGAAEGGAFGAVGGLAGAPGALLKLTGASNVIFTVLTNLHVGIPAAVFGHFFAPC